MKFTPIEIARREERRQAVDFRESALEAEEVAGGTVSFSHPECWSNRAVGLGMDGPVSDADLDRMVAFFRERGCRPEIEVSPFNHESLLRGLGKRGFVVEGFEAVLIFDLDRVQAATHPFGAPQGVHFTTVDPTDEGARSTWVEVSTSGFRPLDLPMAPHVAAISHRMAVHPRVGLFQASIDDRVVGAAAAETFEGTGAMFGTSVLADARGRGIQLGLMIERLRWLADLGASYATVGSKPGIATERNAMRIGFQMAYHRCTFVQLLNRT